MSRLTQRVDRLEALVELALQGAGLNLLGNWGSITARVGGGGPQPLPAPQTGPAATCIGAIVVPVQASGIFLVQATVHWSDNTAADSVSFALEGAQITTPGVIGGAGAAAAGIYSSGPGAALRSGATLGADAAGGAGLTIDGTALNALAGLKDWGNNGNGSATLAGLLTANGSGGFGPFVAGGIISNSNGNTKTPFTVGDKLAIGVLLSATHVITIGEFDLTVIELPVG